MRYAQMPEGDRRLFAVGSLLYLTDLEEVSAETDGLVILGFRFWKFLFFWCFWDIFFETFGICWCYLHLMLMFVVLSVLLGFILAVVFPRPLWY